MSGLTILLFVLLVIDSIVLLVAVYKKNWKLAAGCGAVLLLLRLLLLKYGSITAMTQPY